MSHRSPVFTRNNSSTRALVPEAGGENHVSVAGNKADWLSVDKDTFLSEAEPGQEQTSVCSADHNTKVSANQNSKVKGDLLLESEENRIHIKAAREISIEVGKSKLVMTAEGGILLLGKHVESFAEDQNVIIGLKRVDINP